MLSDHFAANPTGTRGAVIFTDTKWIKITERISSGGRVSRVVCPIGTGDVVLELARIGRVESNYFVRWARQTLRGCERGRGVGAALKNYI